MPVRVETPTEFATTGRSPVQFDADPARFVVLFDHCPTRGCWCSAGTAIVVEVPPGERTFKVVVDLHTGEVIPGRDVPPELVPLADELERDLPADVRMGAADRLEALRETELRHLNVDAKWRGSPGLWPFSHIFRGGKPDDEHYAGLLDKFDEEGHTYSVMDLYCPLQGCDCREVTLSFDRDDGVNFLARRDFRPASNPEVIEQNGVPRAEAKAVLARWNESSDRSEPDRFAARYKALREHAGRPAAPPTRNDPKVGANAPCPCGSGKKYKRCHGAR